jgi:hypothetical protein
LERRDIVFLRTFDQTQDHRQLPHLSPRR